MKLLEIFLAKMKLSIQYFWDYMKNVFLTIKKYISKPKLNKIDIIS